MRIAELLLCWYDRNRRPLPWRENTDPYRVWISEMMLQQTRVEVVLPRYLRFIKRFADVSALAEAPLEDVYKEWEGLGYYSRARYLHEAARMIVKVGFPSTAKGWKELPGVGEYTAGALASICFGEVIAALDGNALRVFARQLAIAIPTRRPEALREIKQAIKNNLPKDRPGDFNQAVMDLGSVICRPQRPLCKECPLESACRARAEGMERDIPIKAPKSDKKCEKLSVQLAIREDGRVLVRKRPENGLLGGMWEFPHLPGGHRESCLGGAAMRVRNLAPASHTFTHRIWHMEGALYKAEAAAIPPDGYQWVTMEELRRLPIPSAMSHWRSIALEELSKVD